MAKEQKEPDLKPRSYAFARRIIRLYASLPKDTISQVPGRQLLRSGTSVGANYREAYRGRSRAEFIAKMGDCLRELDETDYWLELLVDEAIVTRAKMEGIIRETQELIAIFVTIIKRTRHNPVS